MSFNTNGRGTLDFENRLAVTMTKVRGFAVLAVLGIGFTLVVSAQRARNHVPRIVVDPAYFSQSSKPNLPLGMKRGETVENMGSVAVDADGTVHASDSRTAQGLRTWHFAGKNTNRLICDQTGETMLASSVNREDL